MPSKPVSVVYGAAPVGNYEPYIADADLAKVFAILRAHGVAKIDSSQIYGKSEERLGQVKAGDSFVIDTKWAEWTPGTVPANWANKAYIARSAQESITRLGVAQVDIFYLHIPDPETPLEDTLAGVDEAYRKGLFRRFGLSNFSAAGVQEAYDIAKANGYVLPSVYQGNYNAAARRAETELLPTLRRLGMAYYAYSPMAGGLLSKTAADLEAGAGRFGPQGFANGMYGRLYNKPSYRKALGRWAEVAAAEGVSPAEMAYRWVAASSALRPELGDAIVIGASKVEQLEQALGWIAKGGLSDKAVAGIAEFWDIVKEDAPLNNLD